MSENEKEKKVKVRDENVKRINKANYRHNLFLVGVVIVSLILISLTVGLLGGYNQSLNEQVQFRAQTGISSQVLAITEKLQTLKVQSDIAVSNLSKSKDITDFINISTEQSENSGISKFLYIKDDDVYDYDGNFHTDDQSKKALLRALSDNGVYGLLYDLSTDKELFAYVVNAEDNCEFADAFVVLYPQDYVFDFSASVEDQSLKDCVAMVCCTGNGEIINVIKDPDSLINANFKITDNIARLTEDDSTSADILDIITLGESDVKFAKFSGVTHAIAVASVPYCGNLCFVGFYVPEQVYSSGFNIKSMLLTSLGATCILLVIVIAYFIMSKQRHGKTVPIVISQNKHLKCLALDGFIQESQNSLRIYNTSKFAVVAIEVRKYEDIVKKVGDSNALGMLKKLSATLTSSMRAGENLGTFDQERFVMLMQYHTYNMLIHRLTQIYKLALNALSTNDYKVKLNFGICFVDANQNLELEKVVSNAIFAVGQSGMERSGGNYIQYDEALRKTHQKITELEYKLNQGILNEEFKMFYQPKYSIEKKCIDGSEALVRWYDNTTKLYRSPASFLPLFETSGFISTLDRHVLEQVCKFLKDCKAKGLAIVPVSINVSRFTMMVPDFVDFYAKTKKQYQIPDGFLTLEFSEETAYESFDLLSNLVKRLHESGFKCAIDHFGSGYASYPILKSLDIDEIKLDKFFIKDCLTSAKAGYVLSNTISLLNNLRINVTQEGIEDKNIFDYLVTQGCKAIQGYLYSKPLNTDDFIAFIKDNMYTVPGETAN